MLGEATRDRLAHQGLGVAVRLRDDGLVSFELDLQVYGARAEVGAYQIAAALRQVDHEVAVGVEIHAGRATPTRWCRVASR